MEFINFEMGRQENFQKTQFPFNFPKPCNPTQLKKKKNNKKTCTKQNLTSSLKRGEIKQAMASDNFMSN